MPIYEYRCRKCYRTFEKLQSLGDSGDSLVCPECGADRPEKVFSTFAAGSDSQGEACPASSSCGAGKRYG